MSYLEELINVLYNIIKYTIISAAVLLILFFSYKSVYHITKPKLRDIIVSKTIDNRPTYEYLKSVTVYLVHKMGIDEQTGHAQGAIGTGTIVKYQDNNYYILTNKHVCSQATDDEDKYIQDLDHCYIAPTGDVKNAFLKLTYVRSARSGVDLELWKIDAALLPNKQVVKGFNIAHIQDHVYSVGNYLAVPFIYSEGTMAGYEFGSEVFNLPSAGGCSGSGIFNEDGEIIAVLNAGNMISPFQVDTAKALAVSGKNVLTFLGE